MKNAIVSIIIPVFNVEKYINECIKSVVGQTYKNIEILLVDDGSTDSSGCICDRWSAVDERVKVFHKTNEGLGLTRNIGIANSNGKYIFFLDADDYIDITAIELLVYYMEQYNVDAVYCDYCRIFPNGKTLRVGNKKLALYEGDQIIDNVLLEMISSPLNCADESRFSMSACMTLFSKQILQEHNIKFLSEREYISEDLLFQMDYLTNSKRVLTIPHHLYWYRYNCCSVTKRYRRDRFQKNVEFYLFLNKRTYVCLDDCNNYLNRVKRMFLGRVRGCILDLVRSNESRKIDIIKTYCNDPVVVNVIGNYPYWKNPFKQRIFNFLLYKKNAFLLYLIARLYLLKR